MIALEYIFYNNDDREHEYIRIKDERVDNKDGEDEEAGYHSHPLGTFEYHKNKDKDPSCIYTDMPHNLVPHRDAWSHDVTYFKEKAQIRRK